MFFGNPDLLERNLHNDLNTLIKNIKLREDQHFSILQYNKNLIQQQRQLDSIAFLNEEIAKHKIFQNSVSEAHTQLNAQQNEILEKYACVASSEPGIIKLMSRVTARLLQICQSSMEKIKFLDQSIIQTQSQMKSIMMKILNERSKIDIQLLLETIILYVQEKSAEQVHKLQEIIKILQEGNIEKLESLYIPPKKPEVPSIQKRQLKRSLQKKKQKEKEKLQKFKEDGRNAEKLKKKKNKLANKMIGGLYSTMELSRQQFMEDMIFTNPQEKKKKLYEEIMSRNKFNHDQILTFESKKSQYEQKIKQFKEMMEMESRKIQQALIFKKQVKQETPKQQPSPEKIIKKKTQTKSQPPQSETEVQIIIPEKQKMFRRRDKKAPPKAPSPRFTKEAVVSSMQSTQEGFQHIKFDMKNEQIFTRSNRAKLPQISGRSSFDQRYEYKSLPKEEKRINIVKNVDIGTMIPVNKNVVLNANDRKSPRHEREGNSNQGGMSALEYTFYVRKKANKFYETKNNFIF